MRDVDSLLSEIRALPLDTRRELHARLEAELLPPLPASLLDEAERRLDRLRTGEDPAVPLDSFLRRLRSVGDPP